MKKLNRPLVGVLLAFVLLLAACAEDEPDDAAAPDPDTAEEPDAGEDPDADDDPDAGEDPDEGEEPGEVAGADFRGCLVTDAGGVDDRSFNETAYNGLQQAEQELGIETAVLESQSEADFEPNLEAFLAQDCDLIVTVGFALGEATEEAAIANPDQLFAIVDYAYEDTYDNLRELTFATNEAAFLAGYVAAGTTETGTIGTYGGINFPTVSIFMDGFLAGAEHYNQEEGADVSVEGWDGEEGLFTGNFDSQDDGRNVTDSLLQTGADIVMPVAGPVGLGTGTAIQDFGQGLMVWVDTDGYESVPQFSDLMLTSVMKNMDVAVFDSLQMALDGSWEGGAYVGTLENDGVGIAPFHDNEDRVPQEVRDQIEEIRQGIIDGEISVDSADYT
jgi:basic membrane protein A and related proteins